MSDAPGAPLLIDDSQPGVRTLTLNRPQRLNAFDAAALERLLVALRQCAEPGRHIRVVVIRGAGRAFCAGADLKWLASGVLRDDAAYQAFQDTLHEVCATLESADQVVIASVRGLALAGGLELAMACDIVVAADDAVLGDEHILRNLLPGGGGSQRLPRRVGLARGLFHLLTGRRMSGTEAERMGLIALAPPAAQLDTTTAALSADLASRDAHALASMKHMVRRGIELPLAEGLLLERWIHHRYRTGSASMHASVAGFAGRGATGVPSVPGEGG